MAEVKFIYFDVGGVILEFEQAYEKMGEKTGKSYDEIFKVFDTYTLGGYTNTEQILQEYNRKLGISFATYEDFVTYYAGAFLPIQPTHDLIKDLARHYSLGLFSNTEPQTLETSITLGKIPDVTYQTIVASCYVGHRKPEPEIYEIAQERAGLAPEKILFIDDREENIAAAKSLGWHALIFKTKEPQLSVAEIRRYLHS